jgi:hypothetical protein
MNEPLAKRIFDLHIAQPTSEVVEHYRRMSRLARLIFLQAPDCILDDDRSMIEGVRRILASRGCGSDEQIDQLWPVGSVQEMPV